MADRLRALETRESGQSVQALARWRVGRIVLLAVVVAASVFSPSALAASDEVLELSTFLAEVQAQSPEIQAARLRAQADALRIGPAGALPDPFLAAGIDELALGRATGSEGRSAWPRPVLRYQVNQTFPLPSERRALRDAAAERARVAEAQVEIGLRTLRVAAVQLFLRALYLEAALRTNDDFVEALDDAIASAHARYLTGRAAHHDILLAKAERALLLRDRLILRRTLAVLHAQMNELRGFPADREVPHLVDDQRERPHRPLSLGAALSTQPELETARAAVSAADARVRVAKTSGYPDLSLQVMAMQSLTPEMPSSVGAMVGLTVPLFWKRKQGPDIDAARVDRRAAEREQEALRRRIEAEWVAAQSALQTTLDTVEIYEEEILPATRGALESARAGYATEGVSFPDLLNVLRASLSVELEHVAAQTDVRLARLRLEELLAQPPVIQLAPATPTLFAPMGAGMAPGMAREAAPPARPIRMGGGMQPPPRLDTGAREGSGMGGMR